MFEKQTTSLLLLVYRIVHLFEIIVHRKELAGLNSHRGSSIKDSFHLKLCELLHIDVSYSASVKI